MAYDSSKEIRTPVASVIKNEKGDRITITEIEVQGRTGKFADIRLMYTPEGTDEIRPTSKGVRFTTTILADVIKGMCKMLTPDEVAGLKQYLDEIPNEDDAEGAKGAEDTEA